VIETTKEDAVTPFDLIGDYLSGIELKPQGVEDNSVRNFQELDREWQQFVARQAAMTFVKSSGPCRHHRKRRCAPVVKLTKVFRQAALSQIGQSAHRINSGQMPDLSAPQDTTDFDSAMRRFESSRPSQLLAN
jgi:hypothetical protein